MKYCRGAPYLRLDRPQAEGCARGEDQPIDIRFSLRFGQGEVELVDQGPARSGQAAPVRRTAVDRGDGGDLIRVVGGLDREQARGSVAVGIKPDDGRRTRD